MGVDLQILELVEELRALEADRRPRPRSVRPPR
jgi:hypothetical protein